MYPQDRDFVNPLREVLPMLFKGF